MFIKKGDYSGDLQPSVATNMEIIHHSSDKYIFI